MTNLADLIPAGGGQNNTDFVADGTIASGKPVILQSDGKAAEVAMGSKSAGTASYLSATSSQGDTAIAPASGNNMICRAYRNSSGYGTVQFVEVNGTGFTYGTPAVFHSSSTGMIRLDHDDFSGYFVVLFNDQSNNFVGKVVTVYAPDTTTTPTIGTPAAVTSYPHELYWGDVNYDPKIQTTVIAYGKYYNDEPTGGTTVYPDGGWVAVVNPSGGVASVKTGTDVTGGYNTSYAGSVKLCYHAAEEKTVVFYPDNAGKNSCKALTIGAASSYTITLGSAAQTSVSATMPYPVYDSGNNQFILFERTGSGTISALPVALSGTTLSFPVSAVNASDSDTTDASQIPFAPVYDVATAKLVLGYRDTGDSNYGKMNVGSASGTTLTFESAVALGSGANAVDWFSAGYEETDQKSCIFYSLGASNNGYGNVVDAGTSNLTSTNLLGIAAGAISDTATGTINTWGSRNEVQTSLTVASDYYVQTDGTITTSSSGDAQLIGKAITATQINIKDYTG